jgi:WD40 repeat protein
LTAKLVEHVQQMVAVRGQPSAEAGCFLAVIGASGSGKSSLVRAGLVPALKSATGLPDALAQIHWRIHILTPTDHPLEALALSLTRDSESVSAAATLNDDMVRDPRALHLYGQRLVKTDLPSAPGTTRLLLVIDQIEELFTLCRSEVERTAFLDNLMTAARGPALVIIVMRADFYAHCARHPALRQAVSARQEFIGPMDTSELRRAIVEPALRGEWEFDIGLVDLILRDVGSEPGALPLLEHALLETWQRRSGRILTLKGYAAAGGVQGAIARTAEMIYSQLTPEQQVMARRIFLRLTELGEGTQDTRRRVSLAELTPLHSPNSSQVEEILRILADARLITLAENTAEVAHEALIREWPALRSWLAENRESLRLHRHLTESARAWDDLGRDPGELYRGARLAQVLEWTGLAGHLGDLAPLEHEFLTASQSQADRETAEREFQRQRELAAARRLAETERQRADDHLRSARHLRSRAQALAVALLMAVVFLGSAVWFASQAERQKNAALTAQSEAERQAKLAAAREMAGAASANLKTDQDLALLLALQAMKINLAVGETNTWPLQQTIHDALKTLPKATTFENVYVFPNKMVYSPDGRYLVITEFVSEGTVTILDLSTGKVVGSWTGHGYHDVAFSPNGNFLAVGEFGPSVVVWNFPKIVDFLEQKMDTPGEPLTVVPGARLAQFTLDGKLLATINSAGEITVWDTDGMAAGEGLKFVQSLVKPAELSQFVTSLTFSPDGKHLAAVDPFSTVSVWNLETGSLIVIQDAGDDVFFTPDGDSFFSNLGRNWDLAGIFRGSIFQPLPPNSLYALNGSGKIVLANPYGNVTVTSYSGEILYEIYLKNGPVTNLAFRPDGLQLAGMESNGALSVWDFGPNITSELPVVPVGLAGISTQSCKFGPANSFCLAADWNGQAVLADAQSLQAVDIFQLPSSDPLALDFSQGAARLIGVNRNQDVFAWERSSRKELFRIAGIALIDPVFNKRRIVAYTADDQNIVVLTGPRELRILSADTGQRRGTITMPDDEITAWGVSPVQAILVTGDSKGNVFIWDLATGSLVRRHLVEDSSILSFDFSPDGKRLLATAQHYSNRVFIAIDLQTSQAGEPFTTNIFVIGSTAYIGEKRFAVTWDWYGLSGFFYLWNFENTDDVLQLQNPGRVKWATFSADGKRLYLLVEKEEPAWYTYLLDVDELTALAHSRLTRDWRLEECVKYLHLNACPAPD